MSNKISIIIIVKNDRGIADTLAHLMTQEKIVPTEVIVIDASHPDVLKDIKEIHPEVKWCQFIPKIVNKSSIPEQRNYGVQQASGDVIVFIDANCIPVSGWLTKLTASILSGEEDVASGPFGSVNTSSRIIFVKGSPYKYETSSSTGNLVFRRVVWERVGGFDENFLYGSDIDFTWRCVDAGYRIRSVPDAAVSHDWGTQTENLKRYFKYGKARADLLIKHPHRAQKQLFGEVILIPIYTGWLLGLSLTYFFPWYPFTIFLIILRNIRRKPIQTVFLNLTYTLGFLKRFLTVKLFKYFTK